MHRHQRVLWVGIGCDRGISQSLIETAIQQVCLNNDLAEAAITGIATIDRKADEVGLVQLCRDRNWPLRTFSADVLDSVSVPNPSTVVKAEVGTPSVAEAAALCAACESLGDYSLNVLVVSKQIFRLSGQSGAVTLAIAESSQPIQQL